MALITHTVTRQLSGSGALAVIGMPPEAQEGDLAVLVATADDSGNVITLPEGVTQVFSGDVPNNQVGATKMAVGLTRLGASTPGDYEVTFGISDAHTVSLTILRGVDVIKPGNPEFSYVVRGPADDRGLPPCPSVTTTVDGCGVLNIVSDSRGPAYSGMDWDDYYHPPSGITEIADVNEYAGTGYSGHAVGFTLQDAAGDTGEQTWSSIDNNDGGFAGTLVLYPLVEEEEPVEPDPESDPEPEPEPDPDDPTVGPKGEKGDPGPAPQMRTEGDTVQWKHEDMTAWQSLFTTPVNGGGTGGSSSRRYVSNRQMGIQATTDPELGRQRLQQFVDQCASDNVIGYIDSERWAINNTVFMPERLRLVGRGMWNTTIDCGEEWDNDSFYAFRMTASRNNVISINPYLADFGVIGADKTRRDDGPLIRLDGVEDAVIERLRLEDPSSYGLFISGYGIGDYTNDIESDMWNSTHRVTVRDCLALRGQIGFGTEGGAENVLFHRCHSIGNYNTSGWGLHGYRSASGRNVRYDSCTAHGYRNGFLLDRYKHMQYTNNKVTQCRNGIAMGSYYPDDQDVSHDVRIINNYFHCVEENGSSPLGINDYYISSRECHGVVVQGNVTKGASHLRFGQSKRLMVTGNVSSDGQAEIITSHAATGLVANNVMELGQKADGIIDGGNNVVV